MPYISKQQFNLKMKTIISIIVLFICYLVGFSQETGTFTDPRDGKVYKTVKIGTQWIMAENLAYKPSSEYYWDKMDSRFVKKYGYFYYIKTVNNISVPGWHVPTKNEWKKLYKYLGNNGKKAYSAMIEGGSSGFNALLGGEACNYDPTYICRIGEITGYWSSTRFGLDLYCIMIYAPYKLHAGHVMIMPANINYLNVRLFKDN